MPHIANYLKIEPITRVVVDSPESETATPNPFNTIYPFIKKEQIYNVDTFVANGSLDSTQKGYLTPNKYDGSIIITSTVQNLWGKGLPIPKEDLVIGILNKRYGVKNMTLSPQKGITIYVYRFKNGKDGNQDH